VHAREPWFPFPRSKPNAQLRLFCLPPAGGGATLFRAWHELLPDEVEVFPLQLPGREGRVKERPFSRMPELVSAVVSAVLPHLSRPFAIFGHSMGGLVGFELARQLRRLRAPQPIHLFVSASRPPHLPDLDRHHLLSDEALGTALLELGLLPRALASEAEFKRMLLPIFRADAAVTETYSYESEAPLSCALTTFAGVADRQVSCDEVAEWKSYTLGRFNSVVCAGEHGFLTTARSSVVSTVARELLAHGAPDGSHTTLATTIANIDPRRASTPSSRKPA
jgi:medium-chain acyl-[acyl-carrier-protein] hydrolase